MHEDKERIGEGLLNLVRQHPRAARAYDVKLDSTGQPNPETVRQAAQVFTLIRIDLG